MANSMYVRQPTGGGHLLNARVSLSSQPQSLTSISITIGGAEYDPFPTLDLLYEYSGIKVYRKVASNQDYYYCALMPDSSALVQASLGQYPVTRPFGPIPTGVAVVTINGSAVTMPQTSSGPVAGYGDISNWKS